MSLRDQPPIPEDERPDRPERFNQTLLSLGDDCLHSAFLYLKHGGGPASHPMHRGSAFHAWAERATNLLIEQAEPIMPGDVGKDMLDALLAEHPEWTIPTAEKDALRLMVWNWCEHTALDLEAIVGVEQAFHLEIAGVTVSGRLDLVLLADGTLEVRDWKTSLSIPTQEVYDRAFQPATYALLVAEGAPAAAGFPLGRGVNHVRTVETYPRYAMDEGGLVSRSRVFNRQELMEHRAHLELLIGRFVHAFESGEWPAVPGDHCKRCPASGECPIAAHLRSNGHQSEPNSTGELVDVEDVLEAVDRYRFLDAERKVLQKGLRAWAGENEIDAAFNKQESRKVDRDGLLEAARHSAETGEQLDPERFVKTSVSTRFDPLALTEKVLLPEEDGDGEADGDRRWGESLPA